MIARRALWLACLAPMMIPGGSPGAAPDGVAWRDALELRLDGKAWADTKAPFDRFPARAEGVVRPAVWILSRNSAGMSVGFVTDAPSISVRWSLTSERLAMNHMPATGVSGVDLYVRRGDRWHFLAVGQPGKQENEARIVSGLVPEKAEYRLYLPLYNGTKSIEVGVPTGSTLEPAPAHPEGRKPVVVYGTSITQGGCASRPGMAYPAILERRFGRPFVNLGFSGNGKGEPEVARLLAELDPSAFVLDSLPNMSPEEVEARLPEFIEILRERHPNTPIVLVENVVYTDSAFVASRDQKVKRANEFIRKIHRDRVEKGDRRITLVPADNLFGTDGEATVDGVHPTDLGFLRMADEIEPFVRQALADAP